MSNGYGNHWRPGQCDASLAGSSVGLAQGMLADGELSDKEIDALKRLVHGESAVVLLVARRRYLTTKYGNLKRRRSHRRRTRTLSRGPARFGVRSGR